MGEAAVLAPPDANVQPRGCDTPGPQVKNVSAPAAQRVLDQDLVGVVASVDASDPDVAATIDDEAAVALQLLGNEVGRKALCRYRRCRSRVPAACGSRRPRCRPRAAAIPDSGWPRRPPRRAATSASANDAPAHPGARLHTYPADAISRTNVGSTRPRIARGPDPGGNRGAKHSDAGYRGAFLVRVQGAQLALLPEPGGPRRTPR